MADKIAAVIVLRRDGAALLQHRDDKPQLRNAGFWVPPGGHVELDETLVEAARRELREETEYDAPDLQFLTSFLDEIEGWPAYELTMFWCWYDGVQKLECHEGQALAFVERDRAVHYRIPPYLLCQWDAALSAANLKIKHRKDHA